VICGESRRAWRRRRYRPRVPDATRPIFSIGAVARMLDLPPATIRTWETRYGLVVPERSAGGQRLYSRLQVDQLRFVHDEVVRGNRPAQAHRLLAERFRVSAADRQLLELDGFAVASGGSAKVAVVGVRDAEGIALCGRLKARGDLVLALVAPGAESPAADAVLHLPVDVGELLAAARSLAMQ